MSDQDRDVPRQHSTAQIQSFLSGTGATAEQIASAYARSIRGVEALRDKARPGRKVNGQTAEEWTAQLEQFKRKAGEVCAS